MRLGVPNEEGSFDTTEVCETRVEIVPSKVSLPSPC